MAIAILWVTFIKKCFGGLEFRILNPVAASKRFDGRFPVWNKLSGKEVKELKEMKGR